MALLKNRKFAFILLYVILVVVVGMLITEIFLHLNPYCTFQTARELDWLRDKKEKYVVDPVFGFRPILGKGVYDIYGTHNNSYKIEKDKIRQRLLFIGDSVTAVGYIIQGIRSVYGEELYEYWNAGVGSFNTIQEVEYYKKYNQKIKPDHVILTFHLNDFKTTPVAFFNKNNKLIVFSPYISIKNINIYLFKYSMLYRLYLKIKISNSAGLHEEIENNVATKIEELRDLLLADNVAFTVLINPTLLPYNEWDSDTKRRRDKVLDILKKLGVRYFDLTDVLDDAIDRGVILYDHDIYHPSKEMGLFYAQHLKKEKLLNR